LVEVHKHWVSKQAQCIEMSVNLAQTQQQHQLLLQFAGFNCLGCGHQRGEGTERVV